MLLGLAGELGRLSGALQMCILLDLVEDPKSRGTISTKLFGLFWGITRFICTYLATSSVSRNGILVPPGIWFPDPK